MVYALLFLLTAIAAYVYDYRRATTGRRAAFIALYIVMIAVAALRCRLGIDSMRYELEYPAMPLIPEMADFDFGTIRYSPGFVVLAGCLRTITEDFWLYQLVAALAVNTAVFWFIHRWARNPFSAVFLYYIILYINLNMEVTREAFAVSIFLVAWQFLTRRRWLAYYLCAGMMLQMHTSGFFALLLPLAWIPQLRRVFTPGKLTVLVCLGLLAVGFLVQDYLFQVLEQVFPTERMRDRAHMYANHRLGDCVYNAAGVANFCVRKLLLPAAALWLLRHNGKRIAGCGARQQGDWERLVTIYFYICCLSVPMFIFGRYINYLGIPVIVMMANALYMPIRRRRPPLRLSFAVWTLPLLMLSVIELREYLIPMGDNKEWVRYELYYPYTSVLAPDTIARREAFFIDYYGR